MTYDAILKDLKAKNFAPVYFFYGAESFYIDKLVEYCEKNILDAGLQAFNQATLYGKETSPQNVIDQLAQFPMMAPHRVIILKEAQEMKNFGALLPIIEKPVPHGILVISYKNPKVDKRTKLGKVILQKSVVLESKPLYDNQISGWIKDYSAKMGLKVDFNVAQLMAEYLGNDLQKISNELEKLKLNAGSAGQVTLKLAQDQIGISKEYNVFELQNALSKRDVKKAVQIIKYFSRNPKSNPIQMVLANLYSYFTKVYICAQNIREQDQSLMRKLGLGSPFFVKDYKAAARQYSIQRIRSVLVKIRESDLQSKGVGNRSKDSEDILSELIYHIMY